MSVKKEPSGRRSIEVEVEVPGTPEEVWRAIATGPGISSWFVPAEVEGRVDGAMKLSFGPGMDCMAKVTAWSPPRRFAAESSDLGPGAPAMATEWSVEARAGGVCVVRVVHSLFASTADWDNQLEGMESGWPTYFRILRRYLSQFLGQRCVIMNVMAMSQKPEAEAWATLAGSLGLAGLRPEQRWKAGGGAPQLAGVIDAVGAGMHPNTVLVRLDDPAPGTAYLGAFSCGGPVQVMVCLYLYGDRAAALVSEEEPLWQAWMNERFPS